jgi:hypothetical protein
MTAMSKIKPGSGEDKGRNTHVTNKASAVLPTAIP